MGKHWLQTAGVLLLFGVIVILLALWVGQVVPTSTETDYHIQESVSYPTMIRDTSRGMALQLSGTRCFREPPPVPEWNATRHQYQPSYYPEAVRVNAQAADALKQLRC